MKAVPASRYLLFFSIALIGCLGDLVTKSWIFAEMGPPLPGRQDIWWLWPGVLGFQTSLNEGALFGMGQGLSALFSLMSVVAAIAILLWLFVAGAARDRLLTIALALIIAGILGNLYDRLGLPGLRWKFDNPPLHQIGDPVYAVRDWVLVMIGRFHWPNFNLADSMLVVGAGLILCHAFFSTPRDAPGKG